MSLRIVGGNFLLLSAKAFLKSDSSGWDLIKVTSNPLTWTGFSHHTTGDKITCNEKMLHYAGIAVST